MKLLISLVFLFFAIPLFAGDPPKPKGDRPQLRLAGVDDCDREELARLGKAALEREKTAGALTRIRVFSYAASDLLEKLKPLTEIFETASKLQPNDPARAALPQKVAAIIAKDESDFAKIGISLATLNRMGPRLLNEVVKILFMQMRLQRLISVFVSKVSQIPPAFVADKGSLAKALQARYYDARDEVKVSDIDDLIKTFPPNRRDLPNEEQAKLVDDIRRGMEAAETAGNPRVPPFFANFYREYLDFLQAHQAILPFYRQLKYELFPVAVSFELFYGVPRLAGPGPGPGRPGGQTPPSPRRPPRTPGGPDLRIVP